MIFRRQNMRCPGGYTDDQVASYAHHEIEGEDEAALRAHVETCEVCARRYVEHSALIDLARKAIESGAESTDGAVISIRSRRWIAPLWAATILVAVTVGLAAGAYFLQPAPVIVGGVPTETSLAGSLAFEFDLDLEPSGISPLAPVLDMTTTLDANGGSGVVFAVLGPGGGIDVASFGLDGEYRWTASRSWVGWEGHLGNQGVRSADLRRFSILAEQGGIEHRIVVRATRSDEGVLVIADPMSKRHGRPVFIRGRFPARHRSSQGYLVAKILDGSTPLLVAGTDWGPDRPRPGLVLMDLDGHVRQAISLPLFDTAGAPAHMAGLTVLVRPDGLPYVWAETREGLFFGFPLRDGRLDVSAVSVGFSDRMLRDHAGSSDFETRCLRLRDGVEDARDRMIEGWRR